MTVLEGVLLVVFGLSGGLLVAGGLFAFLTLIGVVTRLAAGTKTAKHLKLYEDAALVGGTVGNIAYVYGVGLLTGNFGLFLFGIGAGVFTGCLAAALAEVVKMLPVLSERVSLKQGMVALMVVFALGKMVGSILTLFG